MSLFTTHNLKDLVPLKDAIEMLEGIKPYRDRIIEKPSFYNYGNEIFVADQEDARYDGNFASDSKGLDQTLTRLGLPQTVGRTAAKLDAMKELASMMNKAWSQSPNPILFRHKDEGIFSSVSPSYKRIDTRVVFPFLLDRLGENSNWQVSRPVITSGHSRLIAVALDKGKTLNSEDLFPGMGLMNADDSTGKTLTEAALWRFLCANGMSIPLLRSAFFTRIHRGRRQLPGELFPADLPAEIIDLVPDEEGIWMAFDKSVEIVRMAMDQPINGNQSHYLAGLADWAGATEKEQAQLANMDYNGTVWGFTNRITQLGRDSSKPQDTTAYEKKAWEYLTQATNEWAGPTEAEHFNLQLCKEGRKLIDLATIRK
jgi:hypothetical protein